MKGRENSNIFDDAESSTGVFDMTDVTTQTERPAYIEQWNDFHVGDVVYYDGKQREFRLALAENTKKSEAAGVVCEVTDHEHFAIAQSGKVITGNRYKYPVGSTLYLSDSRNGMLVSIAPASVIKEIATMVTEDMIMVNIKRGTIPVETQQPDPSAEPYTQAELEEIIQNILVH